MRRGTSRGRRGGGEYWLLDMKGRLEELLDREHGDEREVVLRAETHEELPEGAWQAVTYVGHFAHWRHVLGLRVAALTAGEEVGPAPADIEAENEQHLARDRQTLPADLTNEWQESWAQMHQVLRSCSDEDLLRDPSWFGAANVGVAILRNSYTHPRDHLVDFWLDRDDRERAAELCADLSAVTGEFADLHPRFPSAHLFYRGLALAIRGEAAHAVDALKEAVTLRPDLAETLREERRLAFVRELPGFEDIVPSV